MRMPSLSQLLLALGVIAACSPRLAAAQLSASTEQELTSVPRISLEDFKKRLAAGEIIVLDVRGVESYRTGHIPGALSVPLRTVATRVTEFKNSKKPIVTYCA